jgi:hypothetical protein
MVLVLGGIGSVAFSAFLLLGWAFDDRTMLAWLGSYALFSAMTMFGLAYRLWHAGPVEHLSMLPSDRSGGNLVMKENL